MSKSILLRSPQERRENAKAECTGMTDLFFGPPGDGRTEDDRAEREAKAKAICTVCPIRLACLERALVIESTQGVYGMYGVWGGMSVNERKEFRAHLREEGYREIPQGQELVASLKSFYKKQVRRKMKETVA